MRLDLPRSFTLKAFLSHNTLTLEEHSRIFRMTEAQGLFIFESLLNQHIIRPAPYGAAAHDLEIAQERIRPDVRYQANRLLIHPITESLHAKHLIY
jgi:hypothetical protein